MKLTQEIIDNVGELSPAIQLIDTENIKMKIDGDWENISLEDVKNYGGHGMSGMRSLGSVQGDWRMIDAIYSDAYAVFEAMGNELN
jgi:hypothetical protein